MVLAARRGRGAARRGAQRVPPQHGGAGRHLRHPRVEPQHHQRLHGPLLLRTCRLLRDRRLYRGHPGHAARPGLLADAAPGRAGRRRVRRGAGRPHAQALWHLPRARDHRLPGDHLSRHPELDEPDARAHGHSRRAAAVLLRLRAAGQYRLLLPHPGSRRVHAVRALAHRHLAPRTRLRVHSGGRAGRPGLRHPDVPAQGALVRGRDVLRRPGGRILRPSRPLRERRFLPPRRDLPDPDHAHRRRHGQLSRARHRRHRPRDPARGLALPGRVPRRRLRPHPHRRDPLPSRRCGGRAGHHPAAGPAELQGAPPGDGEPAR